MDADGVDRRGGFRRSSLARGILAATVDGSAWLVALVAAVWSRYDFAISATQLSGALAIGALAAAVHLGCARMLFLYRGRHRVGSFDEVQAVALTTGAACAAAVTLNLALPARLVPASSPLVGGLTALVLMLAARYLYRLHTELSRRPDPGRATPVLLFGAGAAGHDLLCSMLRDRAGQYLPVGLLDDDPGKRHLRVQGVRVLGGRDALVAAVRRTGATAVVLAVANADAQLIRQVRSLTLQAGATFKVLPSVGELLERPASVSHLRDAEVTDLLGRRQTAADLAPASDFLSGKRVLVTGAGGSIGSELCRQIHRLGPADLIMLDRDESALHAVELSLSGTALLVNPRLVLADLRDRETIRQLLAEHRPHVIFHAAALKHLPLLERHPGEAVKTNIWGTMHLLQYAQEVETFINISTDKAADPINVLGYSKRITERLTAGASTRHRGEFLSVRFGNVLGSRGSVLTTFTAQASAGGPITVTHPAVTRYFMTVQEAVHLVVQAAAIGRGGEALILDMGEPVRIADVARQLAEYFDSPIPIVYTGLRPGEKLTEQLFGAGEQDNRPRHPLISHTAVPALDISEVTELDVYADREVLIKDLARLCAVDHSPLRGA